MSWPAHVPKVSTLVYLNLHLLYADYKSLSVQVSAYQSGVSLVVDKSEVTTVSLLLQTVRPEDGGEYECRPDNAPPASVRLHVIKGEKNNYENNYGQTQHSLL